MATQIIDSDRRCPLDGKRMLVEIGQNDLAGDDSSGWVQMVHFCLHCDYRERDDQWKRPRIKAGDGLTMAERLHKRRIEGWEIPMRTDIPAVEEVEDVA